jgi:transposase
MGKWPPEMLKGGGAVEPSAREFIEALIQIPELSVTGYQIQTQAVLIFVEVQVRVGQCAPCGALTREINQYIDRKVRHLPVAGKPCYLMFQEPQFCCRPCRHTWVGPLDFRSPNQLDTKAYEQYVAERCREHSWQRVSALENLGYDAVEGIYKRVLQRKLSVREGLEVRVLGIDEIAQHKGHRDVVCVLSDIERGKVIEVLNSRTKAALEASFDGLRPQQRAAIEVVSIDMGAAYAEVARTKVPQAAIVVDRFHVMKNLQEKMQDARRAAQRQLPKATREELKGLRWLLVRNYDGLDAEERQKLQRAFEIWPELAVLHGLKEEFRAFYERKNRRTAISALDTWIAKVQQTGHKALLKFVETVRRWEHEILPYFDERITNGFVEGTNTKIKLIKRRAFGFRNFENFRYRILHECGGL